MADEPKKDHPEDIESILSDLDAILTDMGGDAGAAAAPAPQAPPPPPPKAAPPPPPPPAAAPAPAPAKAEIKLDELKAPPPPEQPAPKPSQGIELAPREGMIKPSEKKPEPPKPAPTLPNPTPIELSGAPAAPVEPVKAAEPPPKPVEPPKAAEPPPKPVEQEKPAEAAKAPPSPTAAPVPPAAIASSSIEELPAETPKEQIRRVAYIHTSSSAEIKKTFGAFLSQSARTISKKPLFLREVLSHEVTDKSDVNAVVAKAQQVKAAAILAVVEGWPSSKVEELSEACSRASMLFRSVAPADAQKKSTAVDIIVDMMLLPGEG